MKKILQIVTSALLIVTISCTNDSPSELNSVGKFAVVEYRVTASCDMMVDVWYRNEAGEMTKIFVPDNALEWSKTVTVETPFKANLSAGFYNNTPDAGNCAVQIIVDDEIVEDYPGSLPSSLSYTMLAEYFVL